ncbi:TPA: hypothetical protein EYO12_04410 [Candidatus Saccharibacteria bacterium]|nr:hypothetical protein [Candidatus Saccharibacteria bacterium]HIO87722.1 hypothetical protein [Candidatus Saccharibacteria bacterium]
MADKKRKNKLHSLAVRLRKRVSKKRSALFWVSLVSVLIICASVISQLGNSGLQDPSAVIVEEEELIPSHVLLNASYDLEEQQGPEAALIALEEDVLGSDAKFDENDVFLYKRIGNLRYKLDDDDGAYQASLLSLENDPANARVDLVLQHASYAYSSERYLEALEMYQLVLTKLDEYKEIYADSDFSEAEVQEIIEQNKQLAEHQISVVEERLANDEN